MKLSDILAEARSSDVYRHESESLDAHIARMDSLNRLMAHLNRELTLAEHYHADQQTWKLAVSLSKIQDIARKAEWECNGIIYERTNPPATGTDGL